MEEGNFRQSIRFLEHRPVSAPPSHHRKVTYPQLSYFAYKTFSLKTIGEFGGSEHEPRILLACPTINLSPTPNSVSVCLASLCTGHTKLHSVPPILLHFNNKRLKKTHVPSRCPTHLPAQAACSIKTRGEQIIFYQERLRHGL